VEQVSAHRVHLRNGLVAREEVVRFEAYFEREMSSPGDWIWSPPPGPADPAAVERGAAREPHRADARTEYMSGSDGVPFGNR